MRAWLRIGYVGRGEPFEVVAFGTDDGAGWRQVQETREVAGVGTRRSPRTVKLFVANLSGSAQRSSLPSVSR